MRSLRAPLIALLLVAAGGCSFKVATRDGPAPPPTEAEARTYFATIVGLAMRGDFDGLCAVGSGTCRQTLEKMEPASVPAAAPLIVGTREIQPTIRADGWTSGGLVLQVCGLNGRGEPYFDEVLVFRDGDRLISTGTIYWSGMRIADDNTVGGPVPPPPPACPR